MFCAVKVIDREGRGTVCCFQYTFDFYEGQSSITQVILVHCEVRGSCPPIYKLIRGPGKLLLQIVV